MNFIRVILFRDSFLNSFAAMPPTHDPLNKNISPMWMWNEKVCKSQRGG